MSSSPDDKALVGMEKVGPEMGLDIPSADPSIGIEEIERRRDLVSDPGPTTRLPPDVMAKRRETFMTELAGFFVINCANSEFSTKCDCPNFRVLDFYPTSEAADERCRELMKDTRVTSIPIKIPANIPFQIPLSEASALNVRHTLEKIARNLKRYDDFVQYRNEEFKRHVEEKTAGETGKSTYSRRKAYLERQKAREQSRDGVLDSRQVTAASASAADLPTVTSADAAPPPPIWSGDLPAHWLKREDGSVVTANDWPRDLESRHGRFVVIAFMDDEDEPSDTPALPQAAKREPIVIVFGGMHESVEAAKDFLTKRIAPWCPDVQLDVVDMYEWLWPTEVDPDAVEEQHRASHAGYDKELNMVMSQRKKTLALAAEARDQSASLGVPLRESNVNALPDIGSVVSARREGMVSYELVGVEESKDDGAHLKSI